MGIPKDILRENPSLSEWNILAAYCGSIAHGMYIPNSDPNSIDDKDVKGICVPPREYYLGLKQFGSRGTKEIKRNEWDIVVYEAKKAVSLMAKGNPNILTLLWSRKNHYLNVTAAGQLLLSHRYLFVGRHVYRSFVGYATSQLRRMTHYKFEGYMGSKRKALVDKFGYDTKNAAHLIRLLRMGIEFLKDGELYIHRHDAPELLAIKRGEWKLERVQSEADRLFKKAEETYLNSELPKAPDKDIISMLCADVIETSWRERGIAAEQEHGND